MNRSGFLSKLALSLLAAVTALAQQPNTLRHFIPAPPVSGEIEARLGSSVALGGIYAAVGAPRDDNGALDAGMVKVFSATTGVLLWVIPNPGPATMDFFGNAIAISGNRLVVGASNAASLAGRVYVYDLASATPTVPVFTLSNPGTGTSFGTSVAIDGTRVVAGVFYNEGGLTNAGRAYVYDLSSATPTAPAATLGNPSPAQNDYFGTAVAVSGTRVLIGALGDFSGASSSGSAHVYDLAGGTPTIPIATLLNPNPATADSFGNSVAISGTRIVVGARDDDAGATNAGTAYAYDLASATPTEPVATLDNPSPGANDLFGNSVAIHGTRVVVGAYGNQVAAPNSGSAYVFDLASATPSVPVAIFDNPTPAQNDAFGVAVAISGTRVLVGASGDDSGATDAGAAYIYEFSGGSPATPSAILINTGAVAGDRFGSAVAVSGSLLVVGAPYDDSGATDSGRAYIYDLLSTTPTEPLFTLNNPSPGSFDYFGSSVAIAGGLVVIGSRQDDADGTNAGSAYIYDLTSGTPTVPVVTLNNPRAGQGSTLFGGSVAISGTRVLVGVSGDPLPGFGNVGIAYLFDVNSAIPAQPVETFLNPTPASDDHFGYVVAISGMRIIIGAYGDDVGAGNAGSAYLYDLAGATPSDPLLILSNPNPATNDNFGSAVAISGTRLVVGAHADSEGAGASGSAYVYDLAGATPALPVATFNNPAPGGSDNFGYSVAISGTRLVIGAYRDDVGLGDSGSAYLYDLASTTPALPIATIANPTIGASDLFGTSVAIDGLTAVIGASMDDTVALDKGFAYVFAPANPDFDGDGLLDLWECACFGSITARTASDDTDGDGRNELLELAFHGDPLVSDLWAAPVITREGGFLTITLQKRAGVNYIVESSSIPDGAAFSTATTTTLTNTATTLKVRDNFTPATATQRSIRVKVTAAP